jgi:hypothetical protein
MKRAPIKTGSRWGMTFVEILIATSISSVLAGSLLVASITIQRNFEACEDHVMAQADQIRLLDYVALDLRRALTVSIVNNTISLTIPDYYDNSGDPRDPVISGGEIDYGDPGAPVMISYYKQDDKIFRNVDGVLAQIAENVDDFQIEATDSGGDSVSVSVSFLPQFRLWGSNDAARDPTTAYATIMLRNKRRD